MTALRMANVAFAEYLRCFYWWCSGSHCDLPITEGASPKVSTRRTIITAQTSNNAACFSKTELVGRLHISTGRDIVFPLGWELAKSRRSAEILRQ